MRTAIVDQAYEMCFALDGGCLVALPSRSHRVGFLSPPLLLSVRWLKAEMLSRSSTAATEKTPAAGCAPDIRTNYSKAATPTWTRNFLSWTASFARRLLRTNRSWPYSLPEKGFDKVQSEEAEVDVLRGRFVQQRDGNHTSVKVYVSVVSTLKHQRCLRLCFW